MATHYMQISGPGIAYPARCLGCVHHVAVTGCPAVVGFAALRAENKALREALRKAYDVGHNLDCILCGFKDKVILDALATTRMTCSTK